MLKAYKKLIYTVAIFFIFILCTFFIKKYFKPFFVILILLFLCTPIYKFLYRRKIFGSKFSALISLVFVNLLFFLVIILLSNYAIGKLISFFRSDYQSFYKNFIAFTETVSNRYNIDLKSYINVLSEKYLNFNDTNTIKQGALYTTDGLFAYFIGNIAAYFILSDRNSILNLLLELFPRDKVKLFRIKIMDIERMVLVELKLVLITTVETILGLWCLGVENCVILGVFCGILDILPYVGTILVFLPLMLYNVMEKRYIIALAILLLYILIAVNRQIMEAKFMSMNLNIPPIYIIISMYVGIKLFGLIGLFMGPLYVLSVKEIIFSNK